MNPSGTLQGGWEYVQAAYGVSGLVLVSYLIAMFLRYRAELARAAREQGGKGMS